MSEYISSNANRFYAAVESAYGQAAPITALNRFPALRVQARQVLTPSRRRDKTGARTYAGASSTGRRVTAFQVDTYFTSWSNTSEPSYGVFFQAGFGASPIISSPLTVAAGVSSLQIRTTAPHGLSTGCGISYGGEIRFITAVPDDLTLAFNAPFTVPVTASSVVCPAITYKLASSLPSITIYDYWAPLGAVSRIIAGASVDRLQISIDGDQYGLRCSGCAADLLDSSSFAGPAVAAGLSTFPTEPALGNFDYSIVPGHLGQVWLGSTQTQFFTLTSANIEVKNNIVPRDREFGSSYPKAILAGRREVIADFNMFAQDDADTAALYAAAKSRTPTSAMLQLGQGVRQLMGIFLPAIVPEIPAYNDADARLEWEFKNNVAQGYADDEIYIAFA